MSSLLLSIDIRLICYLIMFYFRLTNGAMYKWWKVIWCNVEIKNKTRHFLSHKYWICLFVLFSSTIFFLIIRNKQTLIRYCNDSFFVFYFWNGKTENYVNCLSMIFTLSPSASCHGCHCWCLVVVVAVSASSPCRQMFWRLVVVAFVSLLAAVSIFVAASVVFCASSSSESCCFFQNAWPFLTKTKLLN